MYCRRKRIFVGLMLVFLCLVSVKPVEVMASGSLRVATLVGRGYQKGTCQNITNLFKRTRIPNYKNDGQIYTYAYDTDNSSMKKKENQKKVKNTIYSTINKAFEKSTDKDLNIFYYGGHGYDPKTQNGRSGIPIGYINGAFHIFSSKDNEKIMFTDLVKTLKKYHGKFIVIIDCCYAGCIIDAANEILTEEEIERFMFAAATDNNHSTTSDQMSRNMVNILAAEFKKADLNADGCMSLGELFSYMKKTHQFMWNGNHTTVETNDIDFFANLPVFQFNYTKMSQTDFLIEKGKKKNLKVNIKGPKSIKHKLKYTSSNSRIVTVDSKGNIYGKSAGTVVVSVCLTDGRGQECIGTRSSCVVKVYESASIKLNRSSMAIPVNKTEYLSAAVTGKSFNVKWTSSNSSIATVNSKGEITGKKAGTCRITATANGNKATCTVTVKNYFSLFKKEFPKCSWWSSGWKYSFGISGNNVVIGNTYGKIVEKHKINYVQKTSYGYFINIAGYNNYRWYRSKPYVLESYSSASGNQGYNANAKFNAYGC